MGDAILSAIAELKAERERIERALAALRELVPDDGEPDHETDDSSPPASQTGDLTVAESVDLVLEAAENPLTTREIRERSEAMGRVLNPNSVRWTLSDAVKEGQYRKDKKGRVNVYEKVK